ncbi:MAG TPA: hypothetical protein VGJ05_19745 [Fimbriiglobus sp.]|jgi:hypothetical protein
MLRQTSLALSAVALTSAFSPVRARAAGFPQTTALLGELATTHRSLDNLAKNLDTAKSRVEESRTGVKLASALIKQIDKADDGMARDIKQLKTMAAIPTLKMLPPLVKLLEDVRKKVHTVRVKGDKFNADVLKPLAEKLKTLADDIKVTITQVKGSAAHAGVAQLGLGGAKTVIEQRGSKRSEVAGLERTSKVAQVGVKPAAAGIATLDKTTNDIVSNVNRLLPSLKDVATLKPGIDKFDNDLKPFDSVASGLDKVLSHRITIKVLTAKASFTVRQILEGPKNVSNILLKPLELAADKAVEGVMKAFHLKLQAPKEIEQMEAKIEAVGRAATQFPNSFTLNSQFLNTYDQSLATLPKK